MSWREALRALRLRPGIEEKRLHGVQEVHSSTCRSIEEKSHVVHVASSMQVNFEYSSNESESDFEPGQKEIYERMEKAIRIISEVVPSHYQENLVEHFKHAHRNSLSQISCEIDRLKVLPLNTVEQIRIWEDEWIRIGKWLKFMSVKAPTGGINVEAEKK